ncbi:MAG: FKBP-type peptidyl-prolyl cis-trans isomerase, partial [Bacteroidales bacterium]
MTKKILVFTFILLIIYPSMAKEFKTDKDTVSYLLGYNVGRNFKQAPYEFNVEILSQGIKDALTGVKMDFTEEEANSILEAWQASLQKKQEAEASKAAEGNKVAGAAFLEKNKKVKGVTTTASGLQYKIVKETKGPKPLATDKVKVHYVGTLLDGTEFDSSIGRGEPITFPLNQVIPGWTEGVQLMSVGSKYIFYIP